MSKVPGWIVEKHYEAGVESCGDPTGRWDRADARAALEAVYDDIAQAMPEPIFVERRRYPRTSSTGDSLRVIIRPNPNYTHARAVRDWLQENFQQPLQHDGNPLINADIRVVEL